MTEFTPFASLIGGAMIGLSAVLLMLWEGRIAGISGIASRLLPPYRDGGFLSRFGFILGIIAAPLLLSWSSGDAIRQTISSNIPLMIGAACSSASAQYGAMAALQVTACAVCRACRCARWLPR